MSADVKKKKKTHGQSVVTIVLIIRHPSHHIRAHSRVENILVAEAGTAGLNGLNLSLGPWQTVEAGRQFSAVEELTFLGLDRTQRSTRGTADGALAERGTSKRTVLLGLATVGSERVGQSTGGRSGVSTRAVVYRFC